MKKLILLTSTIAIIYSSAFSQVSTTAKADAYLAKAQKQKTAAWIFLGGGVALITTAVIIGGTKVTEDVVSAYTLSAPSQHNYGGESVLMVLGGGAMLTSIPLFIGASNKRHKARLMMTEQNTAIGLPIAVPKKIPSLTLRVSL